MRGASFAAVPLGAACLALTACVAPITAGEVRQMTAAVRSDRPEARTQGFEQIRSTIQRPTCHWPLAPSAEPLVRDELAPTLVRLLDAPDEPTRAAAAAGLRGIASRDLLPPVAPTTGSNATLDVAALVRALDRRECVAVTECFLALDPVPAAAIPALSRIVRTSGFPSQASQALARSGPQGRAVLLDGLADPEKSAWGASYALARVALSPDEIDRVLRMVDTAATPDAKREVLEALGGSVTPGAPWLSRVLPLLAHPDPDVEWDAATLLAKGGDPSGTLRRRAGDLLRNGPRTGAARLVEELGPTPDLVEPLAAVVRDDAESDRTRRVCLQALGKLGPAAKAALPAIDYRLAHPADAFEGNAAQDARDQIAPPRRRY